MDLLSVTVGRKLWTHRVLTLPVLVLCVCGTLYVVVAMHALYATSATYVLVNPPPRPSADVLAQDPALAGSAADNPYTRFPDQRVVGETLIEDATAAAMKRRLAAAGADPRFTIERTAVFGYTRPLLTLNTIGDSREEAARTAAIVGRELSTILDRFQADAGVLPRYRIRIDEVDPAGPPARKIADRVTALLLILGLGGLALLVAVSAGDAVIALRAARSPVRGGPRRVAWHAWPRR